MHRALILLRTRAAMCSLALAVVAILSCGAAMPDEDAGVSASNAGELAEISIEDLMNISVTSVSKKAERLLDTAAAVYVITQEDIRRGGFTSIPEALRLAPGLQVKRIDASKWSISARGFNDRFSNKLLVLVDGRTVYTPSFSGVFWDVQDTMMEDIDRIEVIRGPGATLWGANAVNGVINVVTKSAHDTVGSLAVLDVAGSDMQSVTGIRYGSRMGRDGHLRVYAKGFQNEGFINRAGVSGTDAWDQRRTGFRADWGAPSSGSMTLQGDVYEGRTKEVYALKAYSPPYYTLTPGESVISGSNLLFRWDQTTSSGANRQLQAYFDRAYLDDDLLCKEICNTYDIDYQHHFSSGNAHQMVWGLGFRRITHESSPGPVVAFDLPKVTRQLFSTFFQDEIQLKKDVSRLILGSKFEHNSYTGFEIQPNARLLWTPSDRQTMWAAVSRAVRTPAEAEWAAHVDFGARPGPGGMAMDAMVIGNDRFGSEILTAHEIGYRIHSSNRLSFDLAAFYNVYDDFRSFEAGTPYLSTSPAPHLVLPLNLENKITAVSRGAETVANWNVNDRWRLTASYCWINTHIYKDPTSRDVVAEGYATSTPTSQFSIRSRMDLGEKLEFDVAAYQVGWSSPPKSFSQLGDLPGYTRVDVRLGCDVGRDTNLSLGVNNLFDKYHIEAGSTTGEQPTEIERYAYLRLTKRL